MRWAHVPGCAVKGCNGDASWLNPESLLVYCEGHSREWLMHEDREEFADEWAREAREGMERSCA